MNVVLALAAAIISGVLVLWLTRGARAAKAAAEAGDPEQLVRDAEIKAQEIRKAAESDAKHVRDQMKIDMSTSLDKMRTELDELNEQIKRREQTIRQREETVNTRRREAQDKEAVIRDRQTRMPSAGKKRAELMQAVRNRLAERTGVSENEMLEQMVAERVEEANLRAVGHKKRVEEQAKLDAEARSKRIITISNERFNMSHQPDEEHPGFRLSDPEIVEKIATDQAFKDAFLQLTEAEVSVGEEGRHVDVRSVDPLKREISRRTLVYMKDQGVIHPDRIKTVLGRVQKEVDKELDKAAERAVRLLRIAPLEGEVKRLFSRLLYRASYSQNQWHHAVEVAYVCGMMAAELGLDVRVARRAGLLHDIGKAMTHDHEGSHALLGADVARRQGEPEEVCNAIGAHHGEEPLVSPYAEITAAGDAISGARPGARREIQEAFSSKVQDLERIAYDVKGVERVHIMQGGREVRVFVGEREIKADTKPQLGWDAIYGNQNKNQNGGVSDEKMPEIARSIAEQVEDQLTYPGQIRITVIKETRAVGVAR